MALTLKKQIKPFLFILMFCILGCSTGEKQSMKGSKKDRASHLVDAAQGALMERDPIGALQYLKAAEEMAPDLPTIYHVRALAFQDRKMIDESLVEMKKAVELDPNNSYSNNTYGKFLMDAGQYKLAEVYLRKAAEDTTFRESYKARTSLGMLYYKLNNLELADKNLVTAINDDPGNACIAYYYRGHILVKKGQLTDASKMYEKASTRLCSAFVDAHFALGLVYEKNRNYDLARKKYLDISQNFPDSNYSTQAIQKLRKIP